MADERTLYAGDLTSDQIGKTIRVKVNATTTVEDKLTAVRHARYGERTTTTLWFASTRSGVGILFMSSENGYVVDDTAHVRVLS